jgi:phage terminase large subunit-like protein
MPIADSLSGGASTPLDREFAGHMKFVFNQVLQRLRETGWSAVTAEKAGKLIWRLYAVYQAYREKGKTYTGGEWIAKLVGLAEEAKQA